MKTLLWLSLVLFSISTAQADHKYGFLAESDEDLLEKVRQDDVKAVILGCICRGTLTKKDYELQVTVIDSYKGPLKTGDKISIDIAAEEGPAPEQEIGLLRFFVLTKGDRVVPAGAISFSCDWTDAVRYEQYGETLRKFLREHLK